MQLAARRAKSVVAPGPRAVLQRACVVQDAPAQRALGARGVVAHGPFEQLVERRKGLRALDEFRDRRGFLHVDAGSHVDDDESAYQLRMLGRESGSPSARRATCRPRPAPRGRAAERPRRPPRHCAPASNRGLPPVRPAVPGQVHGEQRPIEGEATVSQVCAFCAPPCRSTSSGGSVPQTSVLTRWPPVSSTLSRRTVGGPFHGSPASCALSRNRPNSSYSSWFACTLEN